jgi:hypothetical protein
MGQIGVGSAVWIMESGNLRTEMFLMMTRTQNIQGGFTGTNLRELRARSSKLRESYYLELEQQVNRAVESIVEISRAMAPGVSKHRSDSQ